MWILKYIVCLIYGHSYIDITWQRSPYQYCLRCGKFESHDIVKELIIMGNYDSNYPLRGGQL
jgi:hypothetical protein